MNGKTTDVRNAVEGTEYELSLDSHREVLFAKDHDDGRRTQVHIERRSGRNSLVISDHAGDKERGHILVGDHDALEDALETASDWMQANPEGINLQCL